MLWLAITGIHALLSFTLPTVNSQCSGSILEVDVNGQLSSPNYPGNYPANSVCQWRLKASDPTTGIIVITFSVFNIYTSQSFVYIYDGNSTAARRLATLTGSPAVPVSYASTQQYMFVRFTSNQWSSAGYRFYASFTLTSSGCVAGTRPQGLNGLITGTLSSPNYPSNYYDNSNCQWRFTSILPTGIVMITFTDFFTESCCDFINIYDGSNETATQLARLSGSRSVPIVFSTTERDMFISFITDDQLNNKGYTSLFVSTSVGCTPASRPQYLEASGTLISPNYPSNYHNDGNCQWRITATTPTGVVMLIFHSFSTQACCDFLYIYDGGNTNAPLIASLNGSLTVPIVIAGTQQEMYIQLSTDASEISTGFTADVMTTSFGCTPSTRPRSLLGSGTLSSPNYPSDYHNDGDCRWLLTSSQPDSLVEITFNYFLTESCCDKVFIYDGNNETSQLIVTLSGNLTVPLVYSTSQQYMFVRFETDTIETDVGFNATFRTVDRGCTPGTRPMRLSGSGSLSSQSYPSNYPNDAECQWLISSAAGDGLVTFTITSFNTEPINDYLELIDGSSSTASPIIATLSGSLSVPRTYQTTNPSMLLKFVSNSAVNYLGFLATYTATDVDECLSSPCLNGATCNDFINGYNCTCINGFVGTYCEINIDECSSSPCVNEATCNDLIDGYNCSCNIGFSGTLCDIDVDECLSSPCLNGAICADFVNGYGCSCSTGFTGTHCETNIDECQSSPCRNGASCIDGVNGYVCDCQAGFTGTLCESGIDECESSPCLNEGTCIDRVNGFICVCPPGWSGIHCDNDTNNCISSPCLNGATCVTLSNGYRCQCLPGYTGQLCESVIQPESTSTTAAVTASPSTTAVVTASPSTTVIQPESTSTTAAVTASPSTTAVVTASPSTTGLPPSTTTTADRSTTILVPINGDACSPGNRPLNLTGLSIIFASPNYPSDYNNNADCQWLLTAVEVDGQVQLDFNGFNTEQCCDYVYIYDGPTAKSPLIATLSGSYASPPVGYISTQRSMFVRFNTDKLNTDTGFIATFTSLSTGDACSPEYRPREIIGQSGTFTSSNYPSDYNNNADCQWRIVSAQSNMIINIDFMDISTETCCDLVYIFDGSTNKDPMITSLSGSGPVVQGGYNSTQRFMFVRFVTDDTVSGKGFNATFTSIALVTGSPCSAATRPSDISGYTGIFTSLNYPSNYDNDANCQWRITAVESYGIVVLKFTDFDTEALYDTVQVYDGDSVNADTIVTLDGPIGVSNQYNSTQRHMLVVFTSDDSVNARGFSATFLSSAPGDPCASDTQPLQLTGSGILTSSNYPSGYNNDADCQWLLASSIANSYVQLDFEDFSTESCCDLVSIYDGRTTKDKLIASLSGKLTPPPTGFTTTQRYMFVRFVTDDSVNSGGFSAVFTSH